MELVPVEHDPFAQAAPQAAAGPTLVPVDHDPFAAPSAGATRTKSQPPPGAFGRQDSVNPAVEGMQFFKGFNNTVGNIALGPVDAVNGLAAKVVDLLGLPPVTAPQTLSGLVTGAPPREAPNAHDFFNRQFVDTVPPAQTIVGRGLERGGEFAAQAVPVVGATNLLAQSGARAAVGAAPSIANAVRSTANNILDTFAAKPVAATAADIGTNVLAGEGAQIGHESGVPGGEALGAIAGAGAPALRIFSPTAWALKGAGALANRAAPYVVDKIPGMPQSAKDWAAGVRADAATKSVGGEIAPVLKDAGAQAEMARSAELQDQIPGFNPTLAKASADPVLLSQQAKQEANASGPSLREWQALHGDNAKAIRDFADQQVPPVAGTPHPEDVVARTANNRVSSANQRLDQQVTNTENQIRQRSDALPETDRAATGDALRARRTEEQGFANNEVNRLRANIANPETPLEVGGQQTTVNAALDRRAAIGQELRDYRSATARNVEDIRHMRTLQDENAQIDRALEGVNLPGMQEYRSYYRDEYVPRFSEGASRDVGRYSQTGYGKSKVASEDVPGQFFGPNNISEARQFQRLYGDNQPMRDLMTDHALDSLRQTAVDPTTGLLREGGVERWTNRHSRVLNEMPWIRDAVEPHDPAALYGRLGDLRARQAAVADTTLSKQLGNEPGKTIDNAISDWRVARTLKNTVDSGGPEAQQALTRAVWERALGAGEKGAALYDATKISDFLDNNSRSLGILLSPDHVKSLRTIIDATKIEGRLPAPKGATPDSNAFDQVKELTGTSVETGLTTMTTLARGRSSPVYEVTRLIGNAYRNFSEKELQAAWKEALTNPQVAKNLESAISQGKATKMQEERLRSYLLMLPGDKADTKDNPSK